MKLYYSKGACSLVVRIVINELAVPCEFEKVDLKTKKTESGADFFKINPKGAVPALETDQKEVLTENNVIQQYLAEKFHAENLLPPASDFKHYRVLEWLNYISTDIHKSFGALFNPSISDELKETLFKPMIIKKFRWPETALEKNKFLMGDDFTLPDAYLFVMLTWLRHFKMDVASLPNLKRYFDELSKRKSIEKALRDEHLL